MPQKGGGGNSDAECLNCYAYCLGIPSSDFGKLHQIFFIVFLTLVRQMQGQTFSSAMTTTCHILTY